MTIETAVRENTVEPHPRMKLAVTSAKAPDFVKGRRDFFKYRDLGVTKASEPMTNTNERDLAAALDVPQAWQR